MERFNINQVASTPIKIEVKTFIDLFAGIGGFRLALESLGLECLFSSEWDKHSQKTYLENFGEIPKGDITKIDESEIPPHDILCAGFPCQAFSISGKQMGFEDSRGTLFFDIARIAKYHKPKILFLENVKNLERHDDGKTFKVILNVLEGLGYNVFHKVLNASEYGSPTARKRIYIVGFRKDLNIRYFDFPPPTYEKAYLKDFLDYVPENSKYVIDRKDIRYTKDINQLPQLKPIQIGKINSGGQGERIYSIEGHAPAITAYGGGIAAKTGAYLIDGQVRKLSPRECARIMGFPDSFKIPVTDSQAYKQFGNSVVVPVLIRIADRTISYIRGEVSPNQTTLLELASKGSS